MHHAGSTAAGERRIQAHKAHLNPAVPHYLTGRRLSAPPQKVEAAATGGRPDQLRLLLRGWLLLSWRYWARARAAAALHSRRPAALAYLEPGAYGFQVYGRGGPEGVPHTLQPTHTREKGPAERCL